MTELDSSQVNKRKWSEARGRGRRMAQRLALLVTGRSASAGRLLAVALLFSAVSVGLASIDTTHPVSRPALATASVSEATLETPLRARSVPAEPTAGSAVPVAASPEPTAPEMSEASVELAEAETPAPLRVIPDEIIEGTISSGETLGGALDRRGVDSLSIHTVAAGMSPVFNFRYARPGDHYRLERTVDGQILRFHYERSKLEQYVLEWTGEEFVATRIEPQIARRRTRVAGLVDQSLYHSLANLGGDPALANDFSEIFAWDFDFSRSVRSGDEFAILYEQLYMTPEGGPEVYVGPGRILAARYATRETDLRALYFESEAGRGGYYRPDGTAMERQFLRAPLHYRRISSSYTLSRLHPILKVRRPHQGIDYAAPTGTPVWAVADGTVIYLGRNGGFGKLVKVRHANGYISYYGHLSRYGKGLKVGSRVGQKQVIGYVGATGLATGPHLDYRLKKDGRYLNPATLRMPAGVPIPRESLVRFDVHRDQILAELEPRPLVNATGAL